MKHFALLALAIATGLALGKLFGGTGLTSLFPTATTTTTTPCYIAAAVFGEDFASGPRVSLVRRWLTNDYEGSGRVAGLVMRLYRKHGATIGQAIGRHPWLGVAFRPVFNLALRNAQTRYQS